MAIRPVVDGVEREFGEMLKVIRLNVQDPAGNLLSRDFGFHFTPTFVLLNGQGEEVWRSVFALDPAEIRSRVGSL
jgi:hypothetical protein